MSRLLIFLILFVTSTNSLSLPKLFGEDLFTSQQLCELHQRAESAMQKKNLSQAEGAYAELLSHIRPCSSCSSSSDKHAVDWPTFSDIAYRLGMLYYKQSKLEEAEALLTQTLQKEPPPTYRASLSLLLAQILSAQQKPGDSYLLCRETESFLPQRHWSKEALSFFHALEHMLTIHYETRLVYAEAFFAMADFEKALPYYREILEGLTSKHYPGSDKRPLLEKRMLFRLAEAENYNLEEGLDPALLATRALQQKNEYEAFLLAYAPHFEEALPSEQILYFQGLYELSLTAYTKDSPQEAKEYLTHLLSLKSPQPNPFLPFVYLQLGKIHLEEGVPEKAKFLLGTIASELINHPIRYEVAFLQGLTSFHLQEYAEALEYFKHCLPNPQRPETASWAAPALHYMGWCSLQLADLAPESERTHLLCEAQHYSEALDHLALLAADISLPASMHLLQHERPLADEIAHRKDLSIIGLR